VSTGARRRVPKVLKIGVPIVIAVVAIGALGAWWFILRDDAPAKATLIVRDAGPTAASGMLDGTWTVQPGTGVFVGYRVQEQFGGDTIEKTAVGRSAAVTGRLTAEGPRITTARVDVDVTKLTSDRSQRDNRIRTDGLETDTFPTASFELTQPIDLGSVPAAGVPVKVQALGNLTLHGVSKPATFELDARWNGDSIDVAGSTPIVMADYSISPPSVGGFVGVDDKGTVELQLTFVRA
jgi:polyisoprenoid-binding protein YceI